MNGTVTRPASRFSFPRIPATATTVMWMGSCLLGGFALGSKVHNPLKTTTLHFEKVAWLTNHESVQLAKLDENELKENQLNVSVDFQPFQLPARQAYRPALTQKTQKRKISPWVQLDRAIKNLKLASLAQIQKRVDLEHENIFTDYSSALRELRRDFLYAIVPTFKVERPESPVAEIVEIQYGQAERAKPAVKVDSQPVSIHRNRNNPDPNSNLRIAEHAIDFSRLAEVKVARAVPARKKPAPKAAEVSVAKAEPTATLPGAIDVEAEIQNLVQLEGLTGREQTAKIPEETPVLAAAEPAPAAQIAQVTPAAQNTANDANQPQTFFNPSLTKEEQKVLTEALLNEQTKAIQGMVVPGTGAAAPAKGTVLAANAPKENLSPATTTPVQQPDKTGFGDKQSVDPADETLPEAYERDPSAQPSEGTVQCAQLAQTRFLNSMGSQICPTSYSWLSKNWAGSGWMKVENENSPAVLTYYPSPNTGSALVLETNSLALLGLKTGARVMKGMGVIVGTVPAGYEVEFAGRAEEAEYFQVQGKTYFAIINAEPGAGVVQLIPKQGQQESATVFAPVLEDTLTYLDLVAPKAANFTVRVVKNGGSDPEVVGLTVGVSTSGKIQAITQSNGRAFLRNVATVPGYPVYVDVSSKTGGERSYTYRYLLKNRNRAGEYVVYQVAEKSLYRWIKQVKQGLSDQSAMVMGFFNRKRLNGFKEHYFVKAEPQTTRFGLEPLNYSILWDGTISATEPLEGDLPRFMSVQVPEGLTRVRVSKETGDPVVAELIPVSPRVIHVVSE